MLRASTLGASPHLLCASPGVAAVLEPREAELEQGAAARSHPAEEPSSTVQSQQSPDFRCFGGSRSHRALRLPLFSCCGCCCFFFHWSIAGSFLFLLRKLLGRCARAPWCASSRSEAAFHWEESPKAELPCSGAALQAVLGVSGAWYFTVSVADRGTRAVHGLNLVQPSVKHRRRSGCAGAEALGRGFWV